MGALPFVGASVCGGSGDVVAIVLLFVLFVGIIKIRSNFGVPMSFAIVPFLAAEHFTVF